MMTLKKNFQHRWSILCDKTSVDAQSNNLSLFNTVEEVHLTKDLSIAQKGEDGTKDIVPMRLEFVTLWERVINKANAKSEVEIDFQSPSGTSLQKIHYTLVIPKKRLRHFSILNGLPIISGEQGRYVFKIKEKSEGVVSFEEVGELPLDVSISYIFSRKEKTTK